MAHLTPNLCALPFAVAHRAMLAAQGRHGALPTSAAVWVQNLTLSQWFTLPRHPRTRASTNPDLMVTAFWSLGYEEQF